MHSHISLTMEAVAQLVEYSSVMHCTGSQCLRSVLCSRMKGINGTEEEKKQDNSMRRYSEHVAIRRPSVCPSGCLFPK